jgi:hypothetical protein
MFREVQNHNHPVVWDMDVLTKERRRETFNLYRRCCQAGSRLVPLVMWSIEDDLAR